MYIVIYLLFLLTIPFLLNSIEATTTEKPSFQDRFRQKILSELPGRTAKTGRDTLPRMDSQSDATTEILSPFSSFDSTPISSAKSSFSSNESRMPSTPQSTRSLRSSTPSSRDKSRVRRPAIMSGSTSFDSSDQYEIAQAFSYVSRIQDERIQNQAFTAVRVARAPKDKEETAFAWLQYLSKIENEADRREAARAVQIALTADKQSEAQIWLNYLTKIPAGPTRNAAIADMEDEVLQENRELVAKIWANYLSEIKEPSKQKQAASAVRKASYRIKEGLAQEWLRVSKINANPVERTLPAIQETNSWWKILSGIKNQEIRTEAIECVRETPEHEKILIAKLWQQYLAKISEKSKRDAAINEILRASSNRWEDIASEHHLQYRLQNTSY